MSSTLGDRLQSKLDSLRKLDLERRLPEVTSPQGRMITVDGESYVNYSSNDYLGLATSYDVTQTTESVLERYGLGSGGSRLISGEHPLFERLEDFLADWKRTESALSFGSGYLTSLGVIRSITTGRDLILYDELSHRCLLEGIELSDAESCEYTHNDVDELRQRLETNRDDYDATLIVTEGIFSMDGDRARLEEITEVSDRYDAWLMVDEAHSAGVWGPDGAGLTPDYGDSVELPLGTLSKAVGGYGGYVAGSQVLREFLINRATTLIYSTGLPAGIVAGNLSALKQIKSREKLRNDLRRNVDIVAEEFQSRGIPLPDPPSQIIPLLTGGTDSTIKAGERLKENGIYAVPIRHPTVPRHKGRIRFSLRADHTEQDLEKMLDCVDRLDQDDLINRETIWSF